jgi:NAD-dependent deacetylase
MDDKDLDAVVETLRTARKLFFITGAGISAESGIPTFRGKEGYWRQHNPMELASPEGFARDPALVWEWYNYRKRLIAAAQPNAAHRTIAAMEQDFPEVLVATQNVDGLHHAAGSRRVVEVHGSIWQTRCTQEGTLFERDEVDTEREVPPRCQCGALLRPNVVWFGESLPAPALSEIYHYIQAGGIGVAFVVGTSALFPYIMAWAFGAKNGGAKVVEINLDETPVTRLADYVFREQAGLVLPEIYRRLKQSSDFTVET